MKQNHMSGNAGNTPMVVDVSIGKASRIRVAEKEYQGETFVDVRLWVNTYDTDGEFIPTRKGVIFHEKYLAELIRALRLVQQSRNRKKAD